MKDLLQAVLQDLGEVDANAFRLRVEPCGNGQRLLYRGVLYTGADGGHKHIDQDWYIIFSQFQRMDAGWFGNGVPILFHTVQMKAKGLLGSGKSRIRIVRTAQAAGKIRERNGYAVFRVIES